MTSGEQRFAPESVLSLGAVPQNPGVNFVGDLHAGDRIDDSITHLAPPWGSAVDFGGAKIRARIALSLGAAAATGVTARVAGVAATVATSAASPASPGSGSSSGTGSQIQMMHIWGSAGRIIFSHNLCLVGSLFVPASTERQQ